MTVKICPACGESDEECELQAHMSVLDGLTRDICWDCIDNNAEPQSVVILALRNGWDKIEPAIRHGIRVCDKGEYVTCAEWSKRVRQRRRLAREKVRQQQREAVESDDAEDIKTIRSMLETSRKLYGEAQIIQPKRSFLSRLFAGRGDRA
ncbi:MAG: hypothetical protein ACR2RE_28175 [Geminicoccaceae bacterium]